jgi:hypothetical protein
MVIPIQLKAQGLGGLLYGKKIAADYADWERDKAAATFPLRVPVGQSPFAQFVGGVNVMPGIKMPAGTFAITFRSRLKNSSNP